MTFSLPFPPSSNNAYTNARNHNGRVKTSAARAYAAEVGYLVADQLRTSEPEAADDLTGQRLRVEIIVHEPDKRRRDIVSCEKLVTDAVFKQLGIDDSQIDHLTLSRGPKSRNGGSLTYTVEPDERSPF